MGFRTCFSVTCTQYQCIYDPHAHLHSFQAFKESVRKDWKTVVIIPLLMLLLCLGGGLWGTFAAAEKVRGHL